MTAPTPAKTRRHALAQWMAVCAAVLVLAGCGGKEESLASKPPPAEPAQTETPPPAKKIPPENPPPAEETPPPDPVVVDPPPPDPVPVVPPRTVTAVPKLTPAEEFAQKKKSFEDHEYEPVIWGRSRERAILDALYDTTLLTGPDPDALKKVGLFNNDCQRNPARCWTRNTDNHLRLINASAAYARGATGKGEIVSVTDDGISHDSNEFDTVDENGNRTGSKVTVTTQSQKVSPLYADPDLVPVPYDPSGPVFNPLAPDFSGPHPVVQHIFNIAGEPLHHGTAVASVIAARRDGRDGYENLKVHPGYSRNMQGVAFDAALHFHQAAFDQHGGIMVPENLPDWTEQDDIRIRDRYFDLDLVRRQGAYILNHSFVWPIDTSAYHDRADAGYIREKLRLTAAVLKQSDTPDADKIIIVRAAGNSGLKDPKPVYPEIHSRLPMYFPELRGHFIAVVAVDQNGDLWRQSNPCGSKSHPVIAAGRIEEFCLAAPGVNLHAVRPVSQYSVDEQGKKIPVYVDGKDEPVWKDNHLRVTGTNLTSGTSIAAPLVSGGLALLRQFFRVDYADGTRSYQLGNTELVRRLFATANKEGKYADADKYGHGLMDLDKATAPVGALATSLSTDPNAQPFNPAAFSLSGNAFGGAMRDALGGVKIAAFDELDAPFFFPLAAGVSHAPQISAGHSDTLHEHEVALGDAANASLALSLAAGELSAARIRRGNCGSLTDTTADAKPGCISAKTKFPRKLQHEFLR